MADAARRADAGVGELGRTARAVSRIGGPVVDKGPASAAVGGLVEAPFRRIGHRPRHSGAAGARHAPQRGGCADVHGVGISWLDEDVPDALATERGLPERAGPGISAVGGLVETHTRDTAGSAG